MLLTSFFYEQVQLHCVILDMGLLTVQADSLIYDT